VVLMDLMMPVMDGLTATMIIVQEFPSIRVVVLTSGLGDDSPEDVLKAGASAYCTKNSAGDTLAKAIRGG
jgi:DNA-binding NarL/FixJ family response regulator